jgi:short-subunit dehydrogenase
MQVNLITPMQLSQRCAPGMKAKRAGLIVNVGSESGVTTQSMVPVYAASKHGACACVCVCACVRECKCGRPHPR